MQYFFKNKIKPYYKKNNGKRPQYEKIKEKLPNGRVIKKDYKWWDLSRCINEYYKGNYNGVRCNLEFLLMFVISLFIGIFLN